MANGAPAWLMVAVPCRRSEALHDAASREPRLRDLSIRDRCEMASMATAGVTSALVVVLFCAPGIMPAPALEARPLSMMVVAVPQAPTTTLAKVPGKPLQAVAQTAIADSPAASAPKIAGGPGPLKRILFGSGQHRVQPFPTVNGLEN